MDHRSEKIVVNEWILFFFLRPASANLYIYAMTLTLWEVPSYIPSSFLEVNIGALN